MVKLALPNSSLSISRMSLTKRDRRSALVAAIDKSCASFSSKTPTPPFSATLNAPLMDVNGVRNSWLTVEINSALSCSTFLRSVTSWMIKVKNNRSLISTGLILSSTFRLTPSLRRATRSFSPSTTEEKSAAPDKSDREGIKSAICNCSRFSNE